MVRIQNRNNSGGQLQKVDWGAAIYIGPEEPLCEHNRLISWNIAAFSLHFVQAVVMAVVSQSVQTIKEYTVPVIYSVIVYDTDTRQVSSETRVLCRVEVAVLVSLFLFISAAAHGYILSPLGGPRYVRDIRTMCNPARWCEYALSSSVIMVAISLLFGCTQADALLLIFLSGVTMNACGYIMETVNKPGIVRFWSPFVCGSVAALGPWIVVFLHYASIDASANVPSFVMFILWTYFVFFFSFPVNMVLQYKQVGRWSSYIYGEKVYIVLSLLSKTILAWSVFAGTFKPQSAD